MRVAQIQRSFDARTWAIAAALFVFTAALFSRALSNGFVNYDDDVYVYANRTINHGLSWDGIVRAFTQPHARNWHPLTTLSHMLDCAVFGLTPAGHHAVNAALHAFSAAGLFLFLHAATASRWRAGAVASLWAAHPLRVESVAWISERKDVLSAALFAATLLAYLHYVCGPSRGRMALVSAVFALGLLAKPMLVSVPLVLLVVDYWPLRRWSENGAITWRNAVLEKAPLFVLAALSCVATILATRGPGAVDPIALPNRLAQAAISCLTYVGQLFWPENLAPFYPLPTSGEPWLLALLAFGVLACISVAAIHFRRAAPYLFAGWFWFLIMLVPVIGFWRIGLQAHADRYTYLPHIGLLIAVVWGSVALFAWLRVLPALLALSIAAVILLGWATWQQLGFWRDSVTLWRHALAVTTLNDVALNNLGLALQGRGDLDGALASFNDALRVVEQRHGHSLSRALVHNNVGNNLALRGRIAEAKMEYQRAIELEPDFSNARVNLGNVLAQEKDWAGALREYDEALRHQATDADAQHRAGIAELRLGRPQEAVARYKLALAADPEFSAAELDLGNAMLEQGKLDEATEHYRRAVEMDPQNADAHLNLGRVYFGERRASDAVKQYEEVVRITPEDADGHASLASALNALGDGKRAAAEFETGLQLAPDSVTALNNFASLLARSDDPAVRDPERAITLARKAEQLAREPQPLIYHTLAEAYAAAGKRDEAINSAERALQLAETQGDSKLAETVKEELAKYRAAGGQAR